MTISINSSLCNDTSESSSANRDNVEEAVSRVLMTVVSTFAEEDSLNFVGDQTGTGGSTSDGWSTRRKMPRVMVRNEDGTVSLMRAENSYWYCLYVTGAILEDAGG